MTAFEFFWSFYGLILGLSVATIATGVAAAAQHRRQLQIGWLTPLLALFVALDIATFWEVAWNTYRDLPFSYGLLVLGLAIALIYFIAASLVFPHAIADKMSLDQHFDANKRLVLLLTTAANAIQLAATMALVAGTRQGPALIANYAASGILYLALIVPAALTRRRWLAAALIGAHTAIYLLLAALTLLVRVPALAKG